MLEALDAWANGNAEADEEAKLDDDEDGDEDEDDEDEEDGYKVPDGWVEDEMPLGIDLIHVVESAVASGDAGPGSMKEVLKVTRCFVTRTKQQE